MSNIDLMAPIIPGTSAGGYTIGSNISSFAELGHAILIDSSEKSVSAHLLTSEGWLYQTWSEDGSFCDRRTYYYKDDIARLLFNSKGILYCIFLSTGYQGTAFQKIGIGSKLSKIKELFEIDYDSGDEMYYPDEKSGITGISFYMEEILQENNDEIDVEKSEILLICVHDWSLDCEI